MEAYWGELFWPPLSCVVYHGISCGVGVLRLPGHDVKEATNDRVAAEVGWPMLTVPPYQSSTSSLVPPGSLALGFVLPLASGRAKRPPRLRLRSAFGSEEPGEVSPGAETSGLT